MQMFYIGWLCLGAIVLVAALSVYQRRRSTPARVFWLSFVLTLIAPAPLFVGPMLAMVPAGIYAAIAVASVVKGHSGFAVILSVLFWVWWVVVYWVVRLFVRCARSGGTD